MRVYVNAQYNARRHYAKRGVHSVALGVLWLHLLMPANGPFSRWRSASSGERRKREWGLTEPLTLSRGGSFSLTNASAVVRVRFVQRISRFCLFDRFCKNAVELLDFL